MQGQEIAWDRAAQASLRNSLAAAVTYYVDGGSYEGLTPASIAEIEPSLRYVRAHEPSTEASTISISVPSKGRADSYAAAAMSSSGRCFLIRDDRTGSDSGIFYGVTEASAPCTGAEALSATDPRWA